MDNMPQSGEIKQLSIAIIVDKKDKKRCNKGCWYLKNLQPYPTLNSIGLCWIYDTYIVNLARYSGCMEDVVDE